MDLRPATIPDGGAWTAAARHGQAILRQHPLPFRKNPNAVRAVVADLTLDAAHFATLHTNGCKVADIGDAIIQQRDLQSQDDTSPSCLTWDLQFQNYVSLSDEDSVLGATSFQDGLATSVHRLVILLDAFDPQRQTLILYALQQSVDSLWVIIEQQGFGFYYL
eukprot:1421811-Rhodomonas_salina.1